LFLEYREGTAAEEPGQDPFLGRLVRDDPEAVSDEPGAVQQEAGIKAKAAFAVFNELQKCILCSDSPVKIEKKR